MLNRFAPVVLLLLAACGPTPAGPRPLEGARIGGAFTLTNQDGERVTDKSLAGKWALVYFGYTYCPDVCPTDFQNLVRGWQAFENTDPARAAKALPVFISVDPERDTPEALRNFTRAFDPRAVGLTGTPAEIAAVAKAYGVVYRRGETTPGGGYLVDHSRGAYLMDPAGKPVALLPVDESAEKVAAELDRWMR